MKRNRERRQHLGGEALPRPKPRRTAASDNWSGPRTEIAGDRNPKKRRGGGSCGALHSQAREMASGYTATPVAAILAISRSSLYYRKKPRGSRADRAYDEQIVAACGEKLAYGYRRVAWWLQRRSPRESQTRAARTRVAGALAS